MADGEEVAGGAAVRGGADKKLLDVGQVLAGKYRIEASLGSGGMGSVYVGRNLRTQKDWALKVLHPEMGARLPVRRQAGRPQLERVVDAQRAGLRDEDHQRIAVRKPGRGLDAPQRLDPVEAAVDATRSRRG